jgi:hypothetical protein
LVQRINTYCLNFSKDLTHDSFRRTIAPLRIPTFWVDDALCSDIIAPLQLPPEQIPAAHAVLGGTGGGDGVSVGCGGGAGLGWGAWF